MTRFAALLEALPGEPAAAEGAGEQLPHRLEAFARYLGLLAAQLQARRAGDAAAMGRLAEERRRLEEELAPVVESATELDDTPQLLPRLLQDALAELERLQAQEEHGDGLRSRWASLGEEALRAGRGIRRGSPAGGGRYPEPPGSTGRVDVRF